MPVKRRLEKRRVDARAEVDAWSCMFGSGFDFFDDLRDIGVTSHHQNHASREVTEAQRADLLELTRAAWHRLGLLFLEGYPPTEGKIPWALRQFGEPHAY